MWVWAKAAGVLGLSVLLMGSKLIIHVPKGGIVVSASGLIACAAGEVCTVDVDEQHFAETFTAIPESGYEFARWGDRAGALCGGSRDPNCAELDGGPFSDFAGSNERLRQASALTMNPAFTAWQAVSAARKARFSVRSFHSTRYYQVRGNSQEEVWAQLHGAANPLPLDREAGTKPLGSARFEYKYDYQGAYSTNGANCRVESGELEFRFETVLPQLTVADQASEQLQTRWQLFQQRITEHEAGHHAIYRQLVTELPQVMTGIGDVPCDELDERVRLVVDDAVSAIRQANADYDDHYGGETHVAWSL